MKNLRPKIRFIHTMTYGIGGKCITFSGREHFKVDDDEFKKELIRRGSFSEGPDGAIRYSAKLVFTDNSGKDHELDQAGFIYISKDDLAPELAKHFE